MYLFIYVCIYICIIYIYIYVLIYIHNLYTQFIYIIYIHNLYTYLFFKLIIYLHMQHSDFFYAHSILCTFAAYLRICFSGSQIWFTRGPLRTLHLRLLREVLGVLHCYSQNVLPPEVQTHHCIANSEKNKAVGFHSLACTTTAHSCQNLTLPKL